MRSIFLDPFHFSKHFLPFPSSVKVGRPAVWGGDASLAGNDWGFAEMGMEPILDASPSKLAHGARNSDLKENKTSENKTLAKKIIHLSKQLLAFFI